jgi:agmatinase
MELYDVETDTEPCRAGIVTMAPLAGFASPEEMVERVRSVATELLASGKTVVGLGGEHSVSIGLIRAHAAHYPGLGVLQLDAHADSREDYGGTRFNHACVMARVAEICPFVQVGIRSLDAAERPRLQPERTFFAHRYDGSPEQLAAILEMLSDPVYITIDLDVLDPAEMPSTGTPEPGGLSYRQVLKLLAAVCDCREVVGFDVVELLPNPHNKAPDFLAARLVYQMMAFLNRNRPGR